MNKKAEIWVSAVLYVLIAIVVMVLVLEAGLPIINGLKDRSTFNRAKETMLSLDQQIEVIASEGQGSQRVIPVEITAGDLTVQDQKLQWKLKTDSKLVEPGTRIDQGNLVITSDIDVSASQTDNSFILQNSLIKANFTKIGSPSNWTAINTSQILNYVYYKDKNVQTTGTFNFRVNNTDSSMTGTGFTDITKIGSSMESSSVIAHINSTQFEYDLKFTLKSKADFLEIELLNTKKK